MSVPNTPPSDRQFRPAVQEAVSHACDRQLEQLLYSIEYEELGTFEECRDLIRDWEVDDGLVSDLGVSECLSVMDGYGRQFGLNLCDDLSASKHHSQIRALAALIVSYLGEEQALEAFAEVERLLTTLGFDLGQVRGSNPYQQYQPFGIRQEDPWRVYEYRNLENAGIHVDLFEYTAGGAHIYVEERIERGMVAAEEEGWES